MRIYLKLFRKIARLMGLDLEKVGSDYVALRHDSPFYERNKAIVDFHLSKHLSYLLKKYRVDCVIDVGANEGQFAKMVLELGFDGRIFSFEPISQVYEELTRQSNGKPNWHIFPYALGDRNGETTFNLTANPEFSSSRIPNDYSRGRFGGGIAVSKRQTVEIRRLENVLDEVLSVNNNARIYLKMDTQGGDLEVFAGVGKYLEQVVALQSEVSLVHIYEGMPGMKEVISRYETAGFEISGMYPVAMDEADFRVIEYDCIMVHPGRLEAEK